ncbi:hypothetical protein IHE44_0004773, partial [Lamprotornis superbus]
MLARYEVRSPMMVSLDSPSPTAARTLTLVAKSVQNLANLVEFGAKNVPELPDTTDYSRTDLSRYLAALHEMCVAHSDELRTLSNERGVMQHVLKKLLAITELLQQKQHQYSLSNNIRIFALFSTWNQFLQPLSLGVQFTFCKENAVTVMNFENYFQRLQMPKFFCL